MQHREQGYFTVPKRDLMAGMRVRVTAAGREEYGAWRAGEHDDLVVAVALACWGGGKYYPGDGGAGGGYMRREGAESWERGVRKEVGRVV